MQNRNLWVFLGALFIAGIAVLLINAYLTGVEERAEVAAEDNRLTRIVVATQELGFGDPLTPEKIRLQNFPANSVPMGAFTSVQAALADNRVALRPIVPGEPILADKVSGKDGRAVLAANLPEGKRAISIPLGAVSGVSGFVRPGDTVDILLTRKIPGEGAKANDMISDIILDRVKVLAIDQVASEAATEAQVGGTAVLEVDPFEAQQLAIAQRLGSLSLALRNIETQEEVAGQSVTNRDVGSNRYIPAPPPRRQASATQVVNRAAGGNVAPRAVPAAVSASVTPTRSGPTMTVYRGTDSEDYSVGRLGGQ